MKNKDNKCRYLMVEAKNVVNYPSDLLNRKFIYYDKCDKPFVDLNEIFETYGIPLEYRKLVIRMNPFISRFECQEYLTEIPFDYTGYTRFRKNSPKIIRGRVVSNNIKNIIEFEAPMEYKTYNEIIVFFTDLVNDELFDNYKMALKEIFDIYFSYDNIEIINNYRRMRRK